MGWRVVEVDSVCINQRSLFLFREEYMSGGFPPEVVAAVRSSVPGGYVF